jgi:hypothetical protein
MTIVRALNIHGVGSLLEQRGRDMDRQGRSGAHAPRFPIDHMEQND